jgi:tetratricopeptide (TPR) repeat protein
MTRDKTTPIILGIAVLLLLPVALNNWSEHSERRAIHELANTHISAGNAALSKGRYLIAEKAFSEALAMNKASQTARQGLYRAQATRIVKSTETIARRDAYSLLYRFEPMPKKDTQYAETYELALTNIYLALGQNTAAAKTLKAATERKSSSVIAWTMQGKFELSQKKYDDAIASFEKAISLDKKSGAALLGMGMALKKQKKYKRAVDALGRAVELLNGPKAGYELGDTHILTGDFQSAYTALTAAANIHPALDREASLLKRLGVSAFKLKKFDEAVRYLKAALQVDKSADTALNLGIAFQSVSNHSEAVSTLNQVIKTQPANAEAHAYLMKSLVQLSQMATAKKLGRTYLARAQNRPKMQNGAALIRNMLKQFQQTQPGQFNPRQQPQMPPKTSKRPRALAPPSRQAVKIPAPRSPASKGPSTKAQGQPKR